jgi:hypothetical protein
MPCIGTTIERAPDRDRRREQNAGSEHAAPARGVAAGGAGWFRTGAGGRGETIATRASDSENYEDRGARPARAMAPMECAAERERDHRCLGATDNLDGGERNRRRARFFHFAGFAPSGRPPSAADDLGVGERAAPAGVFAACGGGRFGGGRPAEAAFGLGQGVFLSRSPHCTLSIGSWLDHDGPRGRRDSDHRERHASKTTSRAFTMLAEAADCPWFPTSLCRYWRAAGGA